MNKPAFPYFGGKSKQVDWITSFFPPHDIGVDLFAGAGNIAFNKPPAARLDVYNDIYADVVNFFRVLRERPDELVRSIDLTPYARREFEEARAHFSAVDFDDVDNCLERARMFYMMMRQTNFQSGITPSSSWCATSWTKGSHNKAHTWNRAAHLYTIAARLKQIQIDSVPYADAVKRYDTPATLFYADPPYFTGTRKEKANIYAHEMKTEDEHRELAGVLKGVEGMVVLSGYPSGLYDELYDGWQCVTMQARDSAVDIRTEALWISPRTWEALGKQEQMEMF